MLPVLSVSYCTSSGWRSEEPKEAELKKEAG